MKREWGNASAVHVVANGAVPLALHMIAIQLLAESGEGQVQK